MTPTPLETCSLQPFLSQVVPSRASPEQAASAMQIFIQQLEGWLRRLQKAICDDMTACCNGGGGGVDHFIQLLDVPNSYAGAANKAVRVNAAQTALEFFTLTLVTAFLQLSDTPSSYAGEANKVVRVNGAENALEFFALSLVTTFLGLSDTPSTYSGQALKGLRVNAGASAVEFFVQALTLLSDFPASYSGQGLKALRVNAGATAVEFFTQVFTLLGDVPNSYSGAADKLVKVNPAATGLEFSNVTIQDIDSIASLSRVILAWTNNNATGLVAYGVSPASFTVRGTVTAVVRPTSGSPISGRLRTGNTSVSGTNRYAGWFDTTGGGEVFRGNGAAEGGFRWTFVGSLAATTLQANQRGFFGMQKALVAAPTDGTTTTAPSAYTDCVMFGYDGGETTLRVMRNDSSGSCTKIDLGAGFPVDTTSMYRLRLYAAPNDSSISYEAVNCGTGAIATGFFSTDLPTNTQTLQPWIFVSSGTTNAAVAFFVASMVLEAYAY